jgi:AraC family transcriptional regulator
LSRFHLQRLFLATAGETPKRFALRLRLGRAAVMLLTADDSVLDVALACGFQSHEVFSRVFRQRFGMTPSAYRQRGFAGGLDAACAVEYAEAVRSAGPCIGLYRIPREGRSQRNDMSYIITKKELAPQPVLLVRRRVKQSEIAKTIGEALPHVFQYAQKNGIAVTGHPLTRYPEMGLGLMTIEVAMRVSTGKDSNSIDPAWTQAAGDAEVVADALPGGPVAVTIHHGPYDKLGDAYAAIEEWMTAQGLAAGGAPWESYITDPSELPDPQDWKTEVSWPLARAGA